jgi:hypothetical protein
MMHRTINDSQVVIGDRQKEWPGRTVEDDVVALRDREG